MIIHVIPRVIPTENIFSFKKYNNKNKSNGIFFEKMKIEK